MFKMNKTKQRWWLFWSPRILGILYALFISLFALDVFDSGYGFWETILALLVHLVPTWIILAALFIAWRWERVGGILFIVLAMVFIAFFGWRGSWLNYCLLFSPLILAGILFLAEGYSKRHLVSIP
jgi:hypothetical protein